MDFIKENYHTGYEPKLDIDKYCYYADESNRNIEVKNVCHAGYQLKVD